MLNYLKALTSNIVKIVPQGEGLKIVCGDNEASIPNGAWLGKDTPHSYCQIKVSPDTAISPNIGSIELAEALARVIPFATTDDARPVLRCVKVTQKEGKLILATADGFRLAMATLDFGDGDGDVLVNAQELRGLIPALKSAKRAKVGFHNGGEKLDSKSLVVDTEAISYKLNSKEGTYPDYEKLIPTEFVAQAQFDTREAIRVSQSLMSLWVDDGIKPQFHKVTITVGDGKVTLSTETGKAEIPAETSGEVVIAVSVGYLIQALKACGGMVEMAVLNSQSPITLSVDGFKMLVMPLAMAEKPKAKAETEAKSEAVAEAEAVVEAQAQAQAEAKPKKKGKRGKAKTVAEPEPAEAEAEIEPTDAEIAEIEAELEPVAV